MMKNEDNILKNVSRETIENLKKYNDILIEWQKKFNLVSNNSLAEAWSRHFLDSAQLFEYIPKNAKKIYDLGSGAGFPALVLAIIFKELNSNTHFVLIESIRKKTLFLNEVISELKLNAEVLNDRIENIKLPKADCITARALTNLNDLLGYAEFFCDNNTICLFPKGKTYNEELEQALKNWIFSYNIHKNKISDDGVILEIKNLRRKK